MGATAEVVFLDRGRLRSAAMAGRVDTDMLAWADSTMDACGIPDGLPVIIVGGEVFEPAWRWQRATPQSQAAGTRKRYMPDVRRLLAYLLERGMEFAHVTSVDLRAYAEVRRRETVASTWAVEEAALMSLFRFCAEGDGTGWRVFESNPWPLWRTARGERSALRRAPDTVPSTPRFLDDDELRHFLLTGIQGRDAESGAALPDGWPVEAPLLPARDLAFVSLIVATGARMTEARLVLIDEVPTDPGRRPWPSVWMRLGGERAKTRGGEVPFDPQVGRLIGGWYRSEERAEMVERAQPRLEAMRRAGRLFVVDEAAKDARGEVTWRGRWLGRRQRFTTTTLTRDAAHHAVRVSRGRIEPLTMWQGWRSGGLPVSPDAFEVVLRDAARRAAAHPTCPFADHLRPVAAVDGRARPRARGGVSAHMLRHTAAVRWMVELEQGTRPPRRNARGADARPAARPVQQLADGSSVAAASPLHHDRALPDLLPVAAVRRARARAEPAAGARTAASSVTESSYVVEVRRRQVIIDVGGFPRVTRVATRLAAHWSDAFGGYSSSASTPAGYATSLRDLFGYLDARRAPPQDLCFLDDVTLDGWVDDMRARLGRESTRARATAMRVLLDNLDGAELHTSLTDGTVLRWRPDVERGGVALSDLAPGQWAALRKFAKRSVMTSTARIASARAIARAGHDPGADLDAWRVRENVYWAALHDVIDIDCFVAANYRRRWPQWLEEMRPSLIGAAGLALVIDRIRQQLLPALLDMAAFWTAMAITTGLPPESVNDLEVEWFDTAPGGDLTILRYRKQRRGTPTLPLVLLARPQFSAQHLRDSYLGLTNPIRGIVTPGDANRLWIYAATSRTAGIEARTPNETTRHFTKWLHACGLLDADVVATVEVARASRIAAARDDQPPRRRGVASSRLHALEPWTGPVDPRRIRKTDKSRRLVMFGLAAAANDHTVRVLIAHYTNSDLVRVRSAVVITEVAETLTAFAAGPRPPAVVTSAVAAAADNESAHQRLAGMLGVTQTHLAAVLAGHNTIGTVACVDPYASPHDEQGRFCRQAGREVCLSCPQAIVLAEHVPALWAEVERLDRIAATMTGDAFAATHGDYHALVLDVLNVFAPDAVAVYRDRGVIPAVGEKPPVRLRRRRTRR